MEMDGAPTHFVNTPAGVYEDTSASLWKVLVSSTSKGLTGFRDVARDVIDGFRFDGMKCFEPVRMEDWGAQDASARDLCADKMQHCDLMVGIIGSRYGSHPPEERTSFTELEYETAMELGISRVMFVLDKGVARKLEGEVAQSEADRQQQFRDRVATERVVELDVASEEDFEQKLRSALGTWVRDYSFKRALVDHSAEFQAARKRMLSLRERTGGAVMVFGKPGTGKTTLFKALLNDTVLKRSFARLFAPRPVRLAAGEDEVKQRQEEVRAAVDDFADRWPGGRAALPPVLIALYLEPDIDTGKDVDPGTLDALHKLFNWDVPRAVILAETNNESVKRRLELDLNWPSDAVVTVRDYDNIEDALEQMRRDAPCVRYWPEPDTRHLVEDLGRRPMSLFLAAKGIDEEASLQPHLVPAFIRKQREAIAHEGSPERKYSALTRHSIDTLSPAAKDLLALMTVLQPKPTLFPDKMAVALDLSRKVDDAIAIVTAEADERQLGIDEQAHLDNAYILVRELVKRGLLERMPRQDASRNEPELLTLHPANVRVIRDYLPLTPDRRAEGHARAEAFYRTRVEEAVSGSFDSHFRMESGDWWDNVGEWIYHLGHTTPHQADISFATLFMDACWWWDLYVKSDVCDKLLEYGQRPRVQAVRTKMPEIIRLFGSFRDTYPREHEFVREEVLAKIAGDPERTGRLREIARTAAEGIIRILRQLCSSLGITELDTLFGGQASRLSVPVGVPAPEASGDADQTQPHLLGLICLFLAEGHRLRAFLDPTGTALATAAACYQTAESCFEAEDDAWDLAWARFLHGEVVSMRGDDPDPLWDAAADCAHEESDTELLGSIERARADHLWARGDLAGALAHYGRAIFYGLTQQVTSNLDIGADAYTQAFYEEVRWRATGLLADQLWADAGSSGAALAEARRRRDVMLREWGGHWQPEPDTLDTALNLASCHAAGQPTEKSVDEIVDAIADAAFFPGPENAVLLKPDSDYYREVNDLIENTREQPWVRGLDRWDKHRKETREKETR